MLEVPQAPPTILGMLSWDLPPVPLLAALGVVLAAVYCVGLLQLRRLGRSWPWYRSLSFLSGCVILSAVTGLAIEGYGIGLFSAFMFQHMTLSTLVPPLLVMGSPGLLLFAAVRDEGRGRRVRRATLRLARSRVSRIALHPGFAIPVFLFSFYGLYFSSIFDTLNESWLGHTSMELFFLVSGLLFIIPILSIGPLPMRQSNLGRLLDIFLEMPLHVFFGVVFMMAPTVLVSSFADPPPQWGINPVDDQAVAGALAWSYGEPVALLVVLIFASRWRRDEQKSVTSPNDYDEAKDAQDLQAYNNFLRTLGSGR